MKKRILALILVTVLTMSVLAPLTTASAATTVANAQADALKELGLFKGSDKGYELDRAPTRTEALVMLIRLLGKDDEATGYSWQHPFDDVAAWADNYVGYAYQKGLTKGVSSTKFGAAQTATLAQYLTFVLRALGYSDSDGDFQWDRSATFASSVGILPAGITSDGFTRGSVVQISWAALSTKLKNSSTTLATKLISDSVFTSAQYTSARSTAESGGKTENVVATNVLSNDNAKVDITNVSSGYVRVAYVGSSSARIKTIIIGPGGTKYTYNLTNDGAYAAFPLSDGSGSYTVGVYVNITGNSYSTTFSTSFQASLKSEFAPFLVPNQYVNYTSASSVAKKAASLTGAYVDTIDKVRVIYNYVVSNIIYDYDKAGTVESGYVPNLDEVMASGRGICFDYASVMTAMLRSIGVPAKLVFGYAGSTYHAWINVYTAETGWMDAAIFFDGTTWKLMDPTFASSGNQSDAILAYINNPSNYTAKYYY